MAEIFEMAVAIKALDYFTGPLRSIMSSITSAEGKFAGLNNTMKMMGKSKAEIDAINASLNRMADQKAFANIASDLEKTGMARQDIAAIEGSYMRMAQYQRDMAAAQEQMTQGQQNMLKGLGMVAAGMVSMKGLTALADKAGQIQMQDIQLGGIYGYGANSKQIQAIQKQAQSLSTKTLFSQSDLMGISVELAHAGLNYKSMMKTVPQATYLAEMEVGMGKSASANDTSYNFARMVDDAGISNNTKQMKSFADQMYRVINVTHASSESLGETFKYAMPVVKQLGWNQNDLLLASAVAARAGMEGSMAGTNIKNFAQRINPYKYLGTKGGDKQLQAMMDAGLISGVTFEKNKKGQNTSHIIGFKNGALLADKNHIKSYSDMVKILSSKHDAYIRAGHGQLEWAALMNKIFGEYGQTFALTSKTDTAGKVTKQMSSQQSLEQQIKTIRQSFEGQMHVFKSNFGTIGTQLGASIMQDLTPALKQANVLLGKFMGFLQKNPKAGKIFADVALGASSFLMLGGSLKILQGALQFTLGGFKMFKLTTAAGEATKFGKVINALKFKNAADEFTRFGKMANGTWNVLKKGTGIFNNLVSKGVMKLGPGLKILGTAGKAAFKWLGSATLTGLRAMGTGLRALGSGSLTVVKALGQFGLTLGRLGLQAARWAVGVAADWLIAMGPVGWIIGGVTAVIAAGVAAWMTNFFGFRDKMTALWNWIKGNWKTLALAAINPIPAIFALVLSHLPNSMKQWGMNIIDGLINGIKSATGNLMNTVKSIGSAISGTFKKMLGINSPSRVFMEHGKFIVQGLAMGIDKNSALATKSTVNLANGVTNSFNPNVKGSSSPSTARNTGETHIHYNFEKGSIVIQAQPGQNPRELVDQIWNELGKKIRKAGYKSGSNPVTAW